MMSQQGAKNYILRELDNLPPDGLREVARFIQFLQFQASQPAQKKSVKGKPSSFGLWSDRPEAQDPAAFAQDLRSKLAKRLDA